MRLLAVHADPIHQLLCLSASPRGRPETLRIPVRRAVVDDLPPGLDALVLTSDLQGVVPAGGETRLAGEALVEAFLDLEAAGAVPPLGAVGVLLAGDLYSDPAANKRGASGDVREVWRALALAFRWVAGVGGNHDQFGTAREQQRFAAEPGIHLLDGEVVELDGLRVGGVSGVIGRPEKPNRRGEEEYVGQLQRVLDGAPDVVVLHEGPDCGRERPGNAAIGGALGAQAPLVVCGHVHWPDAVAALPGGAQVVNVTERVLVLTRP